MIFRKDKKAPSGVVRVTDKTKIKIGEKKISIKNLPEDKVINVTNFPDLKRYLKLKDIGELIKLSKIGMLINRFKKEKTLIYFNEPYYFKLKL